MRSPNTLVTLLKVEVASMAIIEVSLVNSKNLP